MVRFVDPAIDPEAAVTLVLPSDAPVATPAALTVATEWFTVVQVAAVVRSCVLPSE